MKGNRNRRKRRKTRRLRVLLPMRVFLLPSFNPPYNFSCQCSRRPHHNLALYETKLPVDEIASRPLMLMMFNKSCGAHTSKYTHPNPNLYRIIPETPGTYSTYLNIHIWKDFQGLRVRGMFQGYHCQSEWPISSEDSNDFRKTSHPTSGDECLR